MRLQNPGPLEKGTQDAPDEQHHPENREENKAVQHGVDDAVHNFGNRVPKDVIHRVLHESP